ncbi:MAG: electron transfer flavoprotein subunit alpha/FixB family protein, partial [Gammaproteobacteria bacterium]|nr:electron transfer flavoprotein subunit alpha/FixB family protein [Gammaproteobacteria bacterium]
MSNVLIIAEHDGSQLNSATAKAVNCAAGLEAAELHLLVLGSGCEAVAQQAAEIVGITKVLVADRAENAAPLAALLAPQIAEIAAAYDYVFGPSTTFGKDLMPTVAALLDVEQVSDIMEVTGPRSFKRPVYAGNAILNVEVAADAKVVATVRTASYKAAAAGGSAAVEAVSTSATLPTQSRFIELQSEAGERPDLQTAKLVISGGRGVGSKENFDIVYKLADKLAAGV